MADSEIPSFAALRAFEAVFRLGGIRKAAESLGLDHAVVSRHIRQLESWLGVPLVIRAGNRIDLAPDAGRYHARISAALAEIAFASREMRGEEAQRRLRITCIPGLSIQWLGGVLPDFERLHPELVVELKPSDEPANLHAHQADVNIGFRRDADLPEPPVRGLRADELIRPRQMVVASPDRAATIGRIDGPTDLLRLPLLHREHQGDWKYWLSMNGVAVPDELPGILCWHVHMAIAAAKMGRGVLLTSRFMIHEELRKGELVAIDIAGAPPLATGAYVLTAREDRWSSPPVAALRRFLRDRMRQLEQG